MKLYEKYYGEELDWGWVFNNLLDAHFICICTDTQTGRVIPIVAFSTSEESADYLTNEFKRTHEHLFYFRSDYSNHEEGLKARAKIVIGVVSG